MSTFLLTATRCRRGVKYEQWRIIGDDPARNIHTGEKVKRSYKVSTLISTLNKSSAEGTALDHVRRPEAVLSRGCHQYIVQIGLCKLGIALIRGTLIFSKSRLTLVWQLPTSL